MRLHFTSARFTLFSIISEGEGQLRQSHRDMVLFPCVGIFCALGAHLPLSPLGEGKALLLIPEAKVLLTAVGILCGLGALLPPI